MPPTPRRLTTHQQAVLIQVLLTFPDQQVDVCFSPSDSDALAYAQDFLTIFKALGWRVTGPESADLPEGRTASLAVVTREEGSLPACAEALRDALRIYGIEVKTLCSSSREIAFGSFVLAVGSPMND
jgi:hypothetical protein